MTTELRGSEFVTLAQKSAMPRANGVQSSAMKTSLISRRAMRRDRRAIRAI